MDPLAGIGSGALPAPDASDDKDVFDVTTLRYNLQHVDTVRSVMNIASGCVAGICGLTGWQGLALFLLLHLAVLTIIWATKMNFQLRSYTRQSAWSYATANVQQSGLSFTLFWTLFYGLVYLY
ncbi:unnamed protein product [Pseudo-nitzschia multistriata]|uniref:ER membrane protein complex subunit 6 n=1 Tax=Pseudo-nitzschia multistriata TaxID=183589 RepID=A0A448YVH8_9STRA|nr:unnamed protein product [Pseudo-nitzschia multistriata]